MFSLIFEGAGGDELLAELYEAGTGGVIQEEASTRAFFEGDPEPLLRRFAERAPRLVIEPERDWKSESLQAWTPITVGRFFVVPPWSEEPTPRGKLRLVSYPGRACGTGRHPCTQLCLEALEERVRPGDVVVDTGSGSGILSEAARLLGAGRVIGCDIDFEAVQVAAEHVSLPAFCGSVDAIRGDVADVVVANISAEAAEQLAAEFDRVRKAGSTLIVSGFTAADAPVGFGAGEIREREGWACLVVG